jgi:hypothetical protein
MKTPNIVRTERSYTGHARLLAEFSEEPIGEIDGIPEIPSPYAYSPTHIVWQWADRQVIVVETKHKVFRVFDVTGWPIRAVTP